MSRIYETVIRPTYFHGMKWIRLLFWPLASAGGTSWLVFDILDGPGWLAIPIGVTALAVGYFSWRFEYEAE